MGASSSWVRIPPPPHDQPSLDLIEMGKSHSKYHGQNAFCGSAGPEEMAHLQELIDKLSDNELKRLVAAVGINFEVNENTLTREDYEGVIDEAVKEDFYREYRNIIKSRKKN